MKTIYQSQWHPLALLLVVTFVSQNIHSQQMLVNPARGGGLDTNAPMIHADIFYDYTAHQMKVSVGTNQGIPKLTPLPPGYAFDARSNYGVLSGKAYNFQYAWNPGGTFTPPTGAAVWIERLNASPGLECYDGPGNKMENPPRPYAPILGTAGAPAKWPWYGRMAHNAYAMLNPQTNRLFAEYRIYFGDAATGSRDAYTNYTDATVILTWTVDPVPTPVVYATPKMGGGIVAEAPMIHIDVSYDTDARQMQASVDTTAGMPQLTPLPEGYAFDPSASYAVLSGKAYNYQYGWNLGSLFTLPTGAAMWIELLDSSPGLECYDGRGDKGDYQPILGTQGSPRIWSWDGVMAHNTYAIANATTNDLFATYRIYLGDATTGSREQYQTEGDTTVTLHWNILPSTGALQIISLVNQDPIKIISFTGKSGWNYYLETIADVSSTNEWLTVDGPIVGTDKPIQLTDRQPIDFARFYRIRGQKP